MGYTPYMIKLQPQPLPEVSLQRRRMPEPDSPMSQEMLKYLPKIAFIFLKRL